MDLQAWEFSADGLRRRRLAAGALMGALLMGAGGFAFLSTAAAIGLEKEELVTSVTFEDALPEQKQDEPEPEPEEVKKVAPKAAGPRLAMLRPPTEISKEKPKEQDVAPDANAGDDDPFESEGEAESPASPPPPPPPPAVVKVPTAPPKKPSAVTLDERMTPPKALNRPMPEYPATLMSQGLQGTVVVRYKVDETGTVAGAKRVRGPSEFWPYIAAVMRTWRFTPALDGDGKPVAVTLTAQFPFVLKTN